MPSVSPKRSEPPLVLAIDVGTTSVRAILFDAKARDVRGTAASAETPLETTPDGGATIDAEKLLDVTLGVIDEALAACKKEMRPHTRHRRGRDLDVLAQLRRRRRAEPPDDAAPGLGRLPRPPGDARPPRAPRRARRPRPDRLPAPLELLARQAALAAQGDAGGVRADPALGLLRRAPPPPRPRPRRLRRLDGVGHRAARPEHPDSGTPRSWTPWTSTRAACCRSPARASPWATSDRSTRSAGRC